MPEYKIDIGNSGVGPIGAVAFIEADDPDAGSYQARGMEHPANERDRLMMDPDYCYEEMI